MTFVSLFASVTEMTKTLGTKSEATKLKLEIMFLYSIICIFLTLEYHFLE